MNRNDRNNLKFISESSDYMINIIGFYLIIQ